MARTHRSVRVDPDLLDELDDLARQRLVPESFSDQVAAGLRLLLRHAAEEQTRQAAGLVGADRPRAEQTYRRLHQGPRRPVRAGQVWRRPDGLRWVEVQAAAVEPSGWRLMIPLVALDDAADAPPLVVTVGDQRARVHLVTSAANHDLGAADGQVAPDAVMMLQAAVRALVAEMT